MRKRLSDREVLVADRTAARNRLAALLDDHDDVKGHRLRLEDWIRAADAARLTRSKA